MIGDVTPGLAESQASETPEEERDGYRDQDVSLHSLDGKAGTNDRGQRNQ